MMWDKHYTGRHAQRDNNLLDVTCRLCGTSRDDQTHRICCCPNPAHVKIRQSTFRRLLSTIKSLHHSVRPALYSFLGYIRAHPDAAHWTGLYDQHQQLELHTIWERLLPTSSSLLLPSLRKLQRILGEAAIQLSSLTLSFQHRYNIPSLAIPTAPTKLSSPTSEAPPPPSSPSEPTLDSPLVEPTSDHPPPLPSTLSFYGFRATNLLLRAPSPRHPRPPRHYPSQPVKGSLMNLLVNLGKRRSDPLLSPYPKRTRPVHLLLGNLPASSLPTPPIPPPAMDDPPPDPP